jgi:peptidyl-prolyl cis-trans isomerase SurA
MLRITCVLGLFCLMFHTANAQEGPVLDKIIAIVGGEILLQSELQENLALAEEQNGGLPEDADCLFLNQLLSQKLLVNQARLDSILIAEPEIEGQLDARFSQILNLMNNDPKQFLDYYGMTITEAREKLRGDMESQMLAQRMQQQIIADIEITPSEVISFFNQIPTDSLPYFNSEVEIGEIVYFPKPSDEEKQRAKDFAKELRKRVVEGGENFSELAAKHSDDPGSARIGGDLGWQQRGQFVPEFEASAYTLEAGEISEVVETEFGYHVIQLIERLGNRIHTRHILVQARIKEADLELALNELNKVKALIDSDSITFSRAVKKYSSDKAQSYFNSGLMSNPNNGSSFFETSELDVDVYFTIDTMQAGKVSSPIQVLSARNEVSYKLVKLVSMTEPHRASLKEDYSKIKTAALEEKKANYVVVWVEETISNTHIKLDEPYQDCEALKPWMNKLNP